MEAGLSCCLGAAILYFFRKGFEWEAGMLKSVTPVNHLKDLVQLVDATCKVLPLVVTVSGKVGSKTPINCKYSDLRAVIVEETAEQHFLKKNDAGEDAGKWIRDSAMMLSVCKEVPWYLEDGTGCVHVVGAQGASDFVLTVGSEVYEQAGRYVEEAGISLGEAGRSLEELGGSLEESDEGVKLLGVKRIERILQTGTRLTVLGEVVKDDVGKIQIRQPHNGPFYVSHKTIDQLIANNQGYARFCKYASFGFTVFSVYILAKHAFQYIMQRWHHWELRKRALAAATKGPGQDNEGAENENGPDARKMDQPRSDLCVICLEQEYNSVFVPCGHMCCCMTCSRLVNCPICRRQVEMVVRTFRA